jgi:hypothetical protein
MSKRSYKVKTETKFQDELANKNMELQTLRASAAEIEAERRDENSAQSDARPGGREVQI